MSILGKQTVNPDSQPQRENAPRRLHLQKNTCTPVPSPRRCLQATGLCLKEGEAVGHPRHGQGWRPVDTVST